MARRMKVFSFTVAAAMGTTALLTGALAPKAEALVAQAQSITASEKRQGAEVHPKLLEEFGGAYQVAQTSYVVQVGKGIAVQSGLGNARDDFTVTLLNSPVNNAFAIPGGYVYVTRQLLALMNDEAELAGVLGHEVGHVAARHSEKRQKAAQRNSIIGLLGQIGAVGAAGRWRGRPAWPAGVRHRDTAADAEILAQAGRRGRRSGRALSQQRRL